jgi:GDP-L-fucose synthase
MLESANGVGLNLSGKRILVTGGAGFLGSYIVHRLRQLGCKQITVPRRRDFDLTRAQAIDKLFEQSRPEVVIHAAAAVGGIGANRDNPGLFFYENAVMGIQLIEACRRYGVEKTVVLGTICAYPKLTTVPFREENLWDGYPEETNAPYGIAKKALLVQCQSYRAQYGMNSIYLLPVNLYGPRDNFDLNSSHVIPALIKKCAEARERRAGEITLWGDGSPTREFLYVEDAAEAIVAAAGKYNGSEPVNIGSGEEISIRNLAIKIAAVTGFEGKILWDTTKPNGQPRRRLDVSRAERLFGFRARTTLDAGLSVTVDWYKAQSEAGYGTRAGAS